MAFYQALWSLNENTDRRDNILKGKTQLLMELVSLPEAIKQAKQTKKSGSN